MPRTNGHIEGAVDLDALLRNSARVSFDYVGHDIEVEFYPQRYTTAVHGRLVRLQDEPALDPLSEIFSDLVSDWNLTSGGQRVAVTQDTLRSLPLMLLLAMTRAVVEHVTNQGKAASPSPAIS